MTAEEFKTKQKEAWEIWVDRIPADTTLQQAFYAGFVGGFDLAKKEDQVTSTGLGSSD